MHPAKPLPKTHITESLPLALPLDAHLLQSPDLQPKVLLVVAYGRLHLFHLLLQLVQLFTLNDGGIRSVRVDSQTILFVALASFGNGGF